MTDKLPKTRQILKSSPVPALVLGSHIDTHIQVGVA